MKEWPSQGGCIKEAFRQRLYRLVDEFIRVPDNGTMVEIIQLLVTFKSVDSVLEGYGRTTAEHLATAVEVLGSEAVPRGARRKGSDGRRRDELICQNARGANAPTSGSQSAKLIRETRTGQPPRALSKSSSPLSLRPASRTRLLDLAAELSFRSPAL